MAPMMLRKHVSPATLELVEAAAGRVQVVALSVFQAPRKLAKRLLMRRAQVTTSVWRLYAAQHLAANQAMVALLSTPAQPAAAAAKPAACTAAAAACTACPPCSPASVLHAARTPSRGVSKESVARRLVALIRSPSVASSAGSAADSLASHPLDAADAADADAAAANDAAEPARRVRSPGRRAALAAALVPLVVAALAGRRNAGASQPRRAGPPTKRR